MTHSTHSTHHIKVQRHRVLLTVLYDILLTVLYDILLQSSPRFTRISGEHEALEAESGYVSGVALVRERGRQKHIRSGRMQLEFTKFVCMPDDTVGLAPIARVKMSPFIANKDDDVFAVVDHATNAKLRD